MNYAKYINYTSVYNIKHDNGILTVICSLAMKLHNGLHNKTANPCYYGSLHEVLNRNQGLYSRHSADFNIIADCFTFIGEKINPGSGHTARFASRWS